MTRAEFGLGFQGDKQPGDYARLAGMAETLGFHVVAVYGDLLFQPPLGPLLEVAAATSTIRLGPACLNPYSMHPYEIAGQAALLDLASGGRAYLGLAKGAWLGAVGIPQPDPVGHIGEAAAVVRMLLEGGGAGFAGRHFRVEPGVGLRYPPERSRVPLLIGGWGPRVLGLAGAVAGEAKIGGTANPDLVPIVRERIDAGAVPAGRSPADVPIVMGAVSVVDEDRAAARALARTEVAMYLAEVASLDPTVQLPGGLLDHVQTWVAAGDSARAGSVIPDDVLDRFALSGSPEDVAAQAAALFEAGVARVDFGTPHGLTPERGVDLIGTRVLPLLRG